MLDISDVGSIHAFRDFLTREHPEGIDVVVNNAGIAMDGFGLYMGRRLFAATYGLGRGLTDGLVIGR